MTGSLRAFVSAPPRRPHDHVDIVLESGVTLRYHDPRRFGAMLWLPAPAEAHPLLRELGPEPFDPAFDADYLWQATRGRTRGDQAGADGQPPRRRHWQYLRQRIAVSRRDPADDPGQSSVAAAAGRGSSTRCARRSAEAIAKGG